MRCGKVKFYDFTVGETAFTCIIEPHSCSKQNLFYSLFCLQTNLMTIIICRLFQLWNQIVFYSFIWMDISSWLKLFTIGTVCPVKINKMKWVTDLISILKTKVLDRRKINIIPVSGSCCHGVSQKTHYLMILILEINANVCMKICPQLHKMDSQFKLMYFHISYNKTVYIVYVWSCSILWRWCSKTVWSRLIQTKICCSNEMRMWCRQSC